MLIWDSEYRSGLCRERAGKRLKGQKYLRKDGRKHKWDLPAGQSPAFFAQWSIAASGACAVLCHTQSKITFLRWILGHAQKGRMVMCVLPFTAPTPASSFSNSPLRTVFSTLVLCPQTREMQQVQPSTCKTFTAKPAGCPSLKHVATVCYRAAFKRALPHLHRERRETR